MRAAAAAHNSVLLVVLIFLQVIYVTMVYGPIAAFLVELFPAKIRYTSMSLPYHVGNGVFGGLTPLIGTAMVASTHDPNAGLYYPMAIASITFVVGTLFVPETKHVSIWREVEDAGPPRGVVNTPRRREPNKYPLLFLRAF